MDLCTYVCACDRPRYHVVRAQMSEEVWTKPQEFNPERFLHMNPTNEVCRVCCFVACRFSLDDICRRTHSLPLASASANVSGALECLCLLRVSVRTRMNLAQMEMFLIMAQLAQQVGLGFLAYGRHLCTITAFLFFVCGLLVYVGSSFWASHQPGGRHVYSVHCKTLQGRVYPTFLIFDG